MPIFYYYLLTLKALNVEEQYFIADVSIELNRIPEAAGRQGTDDLFIKYDFEYLNF